LAEQVDQPGIRVLSLTVEDMEPIPLEVLRAGIEFIREEKQLGHRIMVACGAGINRSTIYATAALKEEEHLGLLEALLEVRQKHGEALPHPPGWQSLCEYYHEDVPYRAVIPLVKTTPRKPRD
jgi:hypothetical protein